MAPADLEMIGYSFENFILAKIMQSIMSLKLKITVLLLRKISKTWRMWSRTSKIYCQCNKNDRRSIKILKPENSTRSRTDPCAITL